MQGQINRAQFKQCPGLDHPHIEIFTFCQDLIKYGYGLIEIFLLFVDAGIADLGIQVKAQVVRFGA